MIGKEFLDKYNPKQVPAPPELSIEEPPIIPDSNQLSTISVPESPLSFLQREGTGVSSPQSDIELLVSKIESSSIDITTPYDTWLRILFAISDHSGESGRDYAHRISRFHPGYNSKDCDKQYNYCLHAGKSGITISTFNRFK